MKNQESSYKSRPFYLGISVILLVLLIGSVMVAVTMGSAQISVTDVYKVIGYELFKIKKFSDYASGPIHDVIWLIRFPRVVLSIAIGMGLTVSGVIMQTLIF